MQCTFLPLTSQQQKQHNSITNTINENKYKTRKLTVGMFKKSEAIIKVTHNFRRWSQVILNPINSLLWVYQTTPKLLTAILLALCLVECCISWRAMFIHFIKIFQASICRSIISRESQQIVVSHIESFIEKLRANTLMIRHLTGIHCDKKETFKFNLYES